MTEWYMWIVTLASLIGTIANVHQRRWCFYIWMVTNAIWTLYDVYKHAYPQAALMGCYFLLAVWGLLAWTRNAPASTGASCEP